jgi:hypothetical protein
MQQMFIEKQTEKIPVGESRKLFPINVQFAETLSSLV